MSVSKLDNSQQITAPLNHATIPRAALPMPHLNFLRVPLPVPALATSRPQEPPSTNVELLSPVKTSCLPTSRPIT